MRGIFLLLAMLCAASLWAQPEALACDTTRMPADTLTLSEAFKKGKVSGHARYFFMATQNRGELSDYYAHAAGGGLKYESAPFRGWQAGVSGFLIYNVGSSDFLKADPYSGQYSRYEIGLFDVEHPRNKNDMDRLEELYIKYSGKKGSVTFGKQLLNTPFINPQDGRMRPTATEGVYGSIKWHDHFKLEGGWIYKVAPRSTVRWYSAARSVGVNTQGVNRDGSKGNYAGNISSKGIGIMGVTLTPSKLLQVKAFEQVVENVFHTSFLQVDFKKPAGTHKWIGAVQYIHQGALNNGGNADVSKTYFDPLNKVNILGAKAGWEAGGWETTLNYTRIFKGGRFTTPREWGTEPLFTFLSRERNEGAGDVHALMINTKRKLLNERLKLEAGYGHYYLPAFDNAALNKYRLPSYRHLKLQGDYRFDGLMKGLNLSVLLVYKGQLGCGCTESRYLINKVGMLSYNMILNYSF